MPGNPKYGSRPMSPNQVTAQTLAAGAALVVAFIAWEMRAQQPMLPMRLFTFRGFAAGNAAIFFLKAPITGAGRYLNDCSRRTDARRLSLRRPRAVAGAGDRGRRLAGHRGHTGWVSVQALRTSSAGLRAE